MRYDDSIIEQVLAASSLAEEAELAGVVFTNRGRGGEHSALCPFHSESTPGAFSINEEKGVYHCLSCHASGNIFTFLREKNGMGFREALEYLANKHNIPLPRKSDEYGVENNVSLALETVNRISAMNTEAADWFVKQLHRTEAAETYLKGRGFDAATIGAFRIGYGGDGSKALLEHLTAKGYRSEHIVEAGLAAEGEKGGFYDVFRGRVVFPILDRRGRIAGFSGRILDTEKSRAKYLNTKETPLFHKDQLLFGYQQNAGAIRDLRSLVLVEGFMDVIGLWQAGVRFAVAPMGTAFTEKHAAIVRKSGADQVFVMYDPDAAGLKAASETVIGLAGMKTLVCSLPAGKDPDEIALSEGPSAINSVLTSAVAPIQWFTVRQETQKAMEYCLKLPGNIEREYAFKEIAEKLGIPVEAVRADYREKFDRKKKTALDDAMDGSEYRGQSEFETWDGEIRIVINKDFRMFAKTPAKTKDKKGKKDESAQEDGTKKNNEPEWEFELIHSSHVLIPRYFVRINGEVFYSIECRRPNSKPRMITIADDRFSEAKKLQAAFGKEDVVMNVVRGVRYNLHSYIRANSTEVQLARVGVNYLSDGRTFVAGWHFIWMDGRYYPARDNIVQTGGDHYFIAGQEHRQFVEVDPAYAKGKPEPDGKIREFVKRAGKLFKSREKQQIAAAFMTMSILRERLLTRFKEVPVLNFYGQTPSCGKSTFQTCLGYITNTKMLETNPGEYQLFNLQRERWNGLILIDDLKDLDRYTGFLKAAVHNAHRPKNDANGKLQSPQIRNSVFMSTNHSINLEGGDDIAAMQSRIINIPFRADDVVQSVDDYDDLMDFCQENAFSIYLDFYNKAATADMDELSERVKQYQKRLAKEQMKSTRITKMWAILLACGEVAGLKMKLDDFLPYIVANEAETMTKEDLYASALLECLTEIEIDSGAPVDFKGEPERIAVKNRFEREGQLPVVLESGAWLKLSDFTDFAKKAQLLKDNSQESLLREIYGLPYVRKVPMKRKWMYIKGNLRKSNGTYLQVDLSHSIFSRMVQMENGFAVVQMPEEIPINAGNELAAGY
jgi:DNA primase